MKSKNFVAYANYSKTLWLIGLRPSTKIIHKTEQMILSAVNSHEQLLLRCYLKNIITVSSLSKRLTKVISGLDRKYIEQLAFS